MNDYDQGLYMEIRLQNNIPGLLHGCPIGWMSVGDACLHQNDVRDASASAF
jgi:hypothetical protein